ncbi:MAG: phosphate ABC transporter substrate-binding protein [Spirochaetes bacterium]|nr:phosphate ABC transporter substrate-binding protein [Spirochaetota bacterium]
MISPVLLRAQAVAVDPKIPAYAPASGISGNLSSVGSDSLNNVMTLWAEGFKKAHPNVVVQIEGKGSSTAPPALVSGTAQLGPMSRAMKAEEMDAFEKKYGYKPTEIRVAIDTLAVFVHKDNPVKGFTLREIDSIFSSTYKRGGLPIDNWSAFKLGGALANKPISRYGRNSASGTYGFFKEHSLAKGDFTVRVKEQPGSSAVVQGVEKEIGAIGYSGIGYATSGVRAAAISDDGKAPKYVEATYANALNGTYPLTRFLFIYINSHPRKGPEPLVAAFIKYVHSQEGQQVVVKDGYFPLTIQMIDRMKGDIGL